MKKILLVSGHRGSGQTIVLVNLAAGLGQRGRKVLILDTGNNRKLRHWLSLFPKHKQGANINEQDPQILNILPGVDYLNDPAQLSQNLDLTEFTRFYEYLLMSPVRQEDCSKFLPYADHVLVCTDLLSAREIKEMSDLESRLGQSKATGIDLIVPNRINTREWAQNERQLTALADLFGYEIIADPIPTCERIHDLPLAGRTVWDLSQENLRLAFTKLLDAVEDL